MRETSLAASDIRRMLMGLPQPVSHRAAALHLALPRDVAAGIAVRQVGSSWSYRGHEVPWTEDAALDASLLAERGHQAGDTYLDPEALDPVEWVKPIRSGTQVVVFGTDTLLHAPVMTAEVGITRKVVLEILASYLAGDITLPAIHAGEHDSVLVEGGTGGIHVRSQSVYVAHDVVEGVDVTGCGEAIAADLGAVSWSVEVVSPGPHGTLEVEYTLEIGNVKVLVPANVGTTSETVGVARSAYQAHGGATLPPGFSYLGRMSSERVVARHEQSGTSVVMVQS